MTRDTILTAKEGQPIPPFPKFIEIYFVFLIFQVFKLGPIYIGFWHLTKMVDLWHGY